MSNRIRLAVAAAAAVLVAASTLGTAPAEAAPKGDPADWTWLGVSAEQTARWNQCGPITWSAPDDGSYTSRALAKGIRKLGWSTGYTFMRVPADGQITAVIVPSNDPTLVSLGAVAYADIHREYFGDSANGPVWNIVSAQVVIDVEYTFERPRNPFNDFRAYTLPTMLHELGHVMGLGHVGPQEQVMADWPIATKYGAGDRAGLASVKPAVCVDAPPAPTAPRSGGSDLRRWIVG